MPRSKDIVIICLALTSGGLALLTWRQSVEIRKLAQRAPSDVTTRPPVVTFRSAAQRTIARAPLERSDADAPQYATEENGLGRHRAIAPARPDSRPVRGGSALARLTENPEFMQALELQRQAMLDARFAALFRQLHLDAPQLAMFKHLLAEKENALIDVVAVNESSPNAMPLSNDGIRASVRVAQNQIDQAILGSLGQERFAIYQDYENTLAQRTTVTQLEQRLSYTNTPLSPGQSEALVHILANNAPGTRIESIRPVSMLVRATVSEAVPLVSASAATSGLSDNVISRAQTVLTPAQLGALRDIQAEQQAAVRAAALIRQAMPPAQDPVSALMLLLQ